MEGGGLDKRLDGGEGVDGGCLAGWRAGDAWLDGGGLGWMELDGGGPGSGGWMERAWLDGGWMEGSGWRGPWLDGGACGWKVFERGREPDGGMDGVVLRFGSRGSCRVSVQRFSVFCGSQG